MLQIDPIVILLVMATMAVLGVLLQLGIFMLVFFKVFFTLPGLKTTKQTESERKRIADQERSKAGKII